MRRNEEEQDVIDKFSYQYEINQSPVVLSIERSTCGCDYGATSWTTIDEADRIGRLLCLNDSSTLLDVGAGAGWPGVYLARSTGCEVTLADIPLSGLQAAVDRSVLERVNHRCRAIAADCGALPFPNGLFDAISHSDVLCCLAHKAGVLRACRRVARTGAIMVFSVISIVPGLSMDLHKQANEAGPPFIDSKNDYATLLEDTGWCVMDYDDLTGAYLETVRNVLYIEEGEADALIDLIGPLEYIEKLERRRSTIRAIEAGLIQRELYAASTA